MRKAFAAVYAANSAVKLRNASLAPTYCVKSWFASASIRSPFPAGRHEENVMNHSTIIPPRFLVTKEAARFLALSARTLEKHRSYGTGPVYRKIGGRVVYAIADLLAWADKGLRYSTLEPGPDVIYPTSWDPILERPRKQLTDLSDEA